MTGSTHGYCIPSHMVLVKAEKDVKLAVFVRSGIDTFKGDHW